MNSIIAARKKQISKQRKFNTGSYLLDSAMNFSKPGWNLLVGSPYVGTTAVCIKIVEAFSKNNLVLYVDCKDSLVKNRTEGITVDNFILCKPQDSEQLKETIKECVKVDPDLLVVLDGYYLIDNLNKTAEIIRKSFPTISVLATINSYIDVINSDGLWGVTTLKLKRNHYINREHVGHELYINNEVHYISYRSGLLSEAFDYALFQIRNNNYDKSSLFKFKDVEQRGFWKFMNKVTFMGFGY